LRYWIAGKSVAALLCETPAANDHHGYGGLKRSCLLDLPSLTKFCDRSDWDERHGSCRLANAFGVSAARIVRLVSYPERREKNFGIRSLDGTPFSSPPVQLLQYLSLLPAFFAGYYKNFAELCVEHHLLCLRNRLVFEAIGIVFFDVCFYRFYQLESRSKN